MNLAAMQNSAWLGYATSFAMALGASLLGTALVRLIARRYGWVAKPRPDRWHRKPTALFGGIGIYVAFLIAYLLRRPSDVHGNVLLLFCASGMFVLGLVDDYVQLKPYTKLVGQTIISAVFTMFGLRLHWLPSSALDQALTIFWLVGMTNALNLLDNIDGLAAGIAVIASAFMVYFCHLEGAPSLATLTAGFSGAALGFLVFNFNPASIFMGDCGSLFTGFFLGGVTLITSQSQVQTNTLAVLIVPVLVLLIPIVDTALVTINRKFYGRPVSQGGRDHTSHRLVALGFSERSAALLLWILAAVSGGLAVWVRQMPPAVALLVVPVFALVILFLLIFVGKVKVYEPVRSEEEGKGRALLPTLADFSYKRRIFDVLNDVTVVMLSHYAAYLLRFDGALPPSYASQFMISLPVVVACQIGAFLVFGMYRGMWRYTSLDDLSTLLRAVLGGWTASTIAVIFLFRFQGFSRGVFVMDAILMLLGTAGTRISFRLFRAWLARFQTSPHAKRVLIYGAGDGGELLLREIRNNRELGLYPVGFVDDDPQKMGRVIHGVRILGRLEELTVLAGREHIDELVIATTKLADDRFNLASQLCSTAGVNCRRLRISLE